MRIERVELSNFRNFVQLQTVFSPGINVFVGQNGQGKTNLLESLYILSRGESFRPGKNTDLIKKNSEPPAVIRALLKKNDLSYETQFRIEPNRKSFLVNGKKVSSSYLTKTFPAVLFSPESLAAIKEGPEQRRDLVDEFLPSHEPPNAKLLADFRRCLRMRNRVLKDLKAGLGSRDESLRVLEGLDVTYLNLSAQLTLARLRALSDLAPEFASAMKFISGQNDVDISVDYLISSERALDWNLERINDALQNRMAELRGAEQEAGSSLVGPHKHDIRFLFAGEDSRYYCSQGQQRALILSFKMAQIMYHYRAYRDYPFLLLDDVLSELDQEKRSKLVEFLRGIKAQIFFTTTDFSCPAEFVGEPWLSVFNVERGRVEIAS